MKHYLNSRKGLMFFFLVLILIVNGVLMTSGVAVNHVDIRYLNLLMVFLSLGYLSYDAYTYYRGQYCFLKRLEEGQVMDTRVISKDQGLNHLIDRLNEIHEHELMALEADREDLEDYLNRWVHEIKIPIAVASMIGQSLDPREQKELDYEIERITYYVNQALYMSKAGHSSKDLHIESFLLKPLVADVVRGYKVFFIQKDLAVDMDIEAGIQVTTDKQWLTYALEQILHNAIKYTKASGQIEIVVRQSSGYLEIAIRDEGMGISSQEVGKVFQKGFVGSNGRAHKTATGMGMYLSQKMIRLLEGHIEVTSELGVGSCFTISLKQLDEGTRLSRRGPSGSK